VIARVWRGATRAEDEAAYVDYVETCIADTRKLPGSRGTLVLHRVVGDRAEFQTMLLFDSIDDVHAFAGDDISVAVFYSEDDRYLVDRELVVDHYEVDAHIV
jgi:antibiotic biosynthesis monooxygenase (ABM) superfamily enzyme